MKVRCGMVLGSLCCFFAVTNFAAAAGLETEQGIQAGAQVSGGNSLNAAFGAAFPESISIPLSEAGEQQEIAAAGENTLTGEARYVPNHPWQDFEVDFFIAVPFAAFYSYLTVLSLDGIVQNHFPPELRQADIWVIMGLAAGSAFAVALGSVGRVPDQSVPRTESAGAVCPEGRPDPAGVLIRVAGIQIRY